MTKRSKIDHVVNRLLHDGFIQADVVQEMKTVIEKFSFEISDEMAALIDANDKNDPIAKQFIPSPAELTISAHESTDPIGDQAFSAVKGVVHRYPDRCLLMPVQVCPVYCRFCFRRETVGSHAHTLTPLELNNACQYIASDKNIWEVILTGGDPLILKAKSLQAILGKLSCIDHVEVIRIHTRVPLVTPRRIDTETLTSLQCGKTVYVVLHANHAKEFTPAGIAACNAIIDAGIPMLSQTTLLNGINDDINSLSELMRTFVKHRIKPYYLHHADLAKGTAHHRTSLEKGQELMKQLRGRFSGLCQPTYVLDLPGGHGKMPVGPNYLADLGEQYQIEDYLGEVHSYTKNPG